MRRIATAAPALVFAMFWSAWAAALELGDIQVSSALHQPLRASIEVHDFGPEQWASLQVGLADEKLHRQMQIDYSPRLQQLRFQLQRNGDGARILVSTEEPQHEPFIDFLLQLEWNKGRLLREFVILLDPPRFMQQKMPAVEHPAAVTAVAPSTTERAPPASTLSSGKAAVHYGPVAAGETLWHIAERLRPADISNEQMMLALLRENPQAFVGGNVNRLRQGAVLRLSDLAVARALPADEAAREFARQYQQWLAESRAGRPGRPVPESASGDPRVDGQALPAARLELVAVDQAKLSAGKAAADESLRELRTKLALVNEAVAVAERRNQELDQRLERLQTQMEQMRRLLELKTQELKRLSETGVSAEAEAPPRKLALLGEAAVPAAEPLPNPDLDPARLWRDPWLIGTVLAAVLVVFAMAWILYRARRRSAEPVPQPADEPGTSVGLEPLTELAHDESFWQSENEIDPLIEADLYLLYEKFDKAEALLQQAIAADPQRHELKLKLLETACKKRDAEAFMNLAEEFFAVLEGNDQHPLWREAVAMAQELRLDNPLFDHRDGGVRQAPARSQESPFEQEDPVGTQLDLARAYIEMDDLVAAREALRNVVAQGTSEQRRQAQALLDSVDQKEQERK